MASTVSIAFFQAGRKPMSNTFPSRLPGIMPQGINKAHSLELLCEKLGIQREEVMACGDNTNDAEMVVWAGLGVAVAHAVDSLKAAADYVCSEERSYGVAEAIEKFCM